MVSAGGVRAEIVTVQGDNGAAGEDGVNPGDPGLPGGDGESVAGQRRQHAAHHRSSE